MSDRVTLASVFFITLLLVIGLVFFIRGSFKDRTTTQLFESDLDRPTLIARLQDYFRSRAYRVIENDPTEQRVVFEGIVAPSLFLAVFVATLAATGLGCLGLVVAIATGSSPQLALIPATLAPIAGRLYWQKAKRPERVTLAFTAADRSDLTVTAHRDELITLTQSLPLRALES
ncbi:cofactor assembly of complex C subunit B [Synechococcus elongatus]|uniref:Cofactor assembly of complex C subunit B n=1 Tax=Synechococcus elongatus (strain ATCC 33912 / PCC 7942 / FACHB-805) TaxID=1140 RepID=Q31QG2_SYNE7|nr:cofactor assembly of complex C subunit B [Synechococcus elongatus]ABB56707.1 conserved hypothetical protein [Synechococcus elongatus PCC 7942 = FACHB-805]AJD58751.1 hypothetical protein M744_13430 [Synechococcus elongatus UTEX 2973]MBD2588566.1 cofactor assembly of complex C subunit B [Synechococcus elongatus FACHB-242]MBD2689845.1 cofactor assembly of complex C subunit B [Synechococcus elongatus FACHB-1061]MBD2708452.1 cofactor assembly of complex C subunit B [Synechococcus elongatus PCC 7